MLNFADKTADKWQCCLHILGIKFVFLMLNELKLFSGQWSYYTFELKI